MQYKQVREIATSILKSLEQHCEKADVVGSVRREKEDCHDLEICCIPKTSKSADLFGNPLSEQRSSAFCAAVRSLGLVLKGDIEKGRYVQLSLSNGLNFDLFMPIPADYFRQVVIRTGCKDYSHKVIATGWLRKGFCGTDDGLRLQSESYQKKVGQYPDGRDKFKWICNNPNPTLPPLWSDEYSFFEWLNITWLEPNKRNI